MARDPSDQILVGTDTPPTRQELAQLLRGLRRRHARQRGERPIAYRQLAATTGWAVGTVSDYFTGNALPPTDRFDVLVQLLGATGAEQRALATFRDRVEEHQRPRHAPGARSAPVVPRQLPAPPMPFVGRAAELAELTALADRSTMAASTVTISAVAGTAGIGKTALALYWAHTVADRFPDGQLYVDLRGFDPTGAVVEPAEAIRRFLDVLEVPPARIPSDLDSQAALYRSLLAGRRMLVVLDNARDAAQVRPLLPATAGCLALVTSRNQLTPLVAVHGAHPLTLDLLSPAESAALLAERLGAEQVAAEPDAVSEVIDGCARLPLALAIAAAHAQANRFPITAIATELTRAHSRLDALNAGDAFTEVRAVFSWSYDALSAGAARLFRLLGLHLGPDITAAAAAGLAGLPLPKVRPSLAELAAASLLIEHAPGRYVLHDLLRTYATELVGSRDPEHERRAAVGRLMDHYTHTAHAADRLLHPARDPIVVPLAAPAPGAGPEPLADRSAAMAWLAAERPVLLALLRHADQLGFEAQIWQLAWSLDTYLHRQGHWHDLTAAWQTAVRAAYRLDDSAGQAFAHRLLAHAHSRLRGHTDAHRHLTRALDLYVRRGDEVGQADTHRSFTVLYEQQGQLRQALDHAAQALARYRSAGHLRGQAVALNAVGWYHALLGNHTEALACCDRALALFTKLDDRDGEAHTSDSLGYAYHLLGRHDRAVRRYERARSLFSALEDRYSEARVLISLGDTHDAAGSTGEAEHAWREALDILTDLDHPDAEGVRARLSGFRIVREP